MENIEKYLDWIREGRSFAEIREDLKKNGVPEEEVSRLIAEIDDTAIQAAAAGSAFSRLDWTKIGLAMMALGVLCYLLFQKVLHFTGSLTATVVLLAAGGAMIVLGYKSRNKQGGISRRGKRKFSLKSGE